MSEAAGSISLAESNLRTLLASCAAWQSWTGAGTASAASERIFIAGTPLPAIADTYTLEEMEQRLRPFALIDTHPSEGFGVEAIASGTGFSFRERGRLWMQIEDNAGPVDVLGPTESDRVFKNNLGKVINDLCGLAASGGHFRMQGLTIESMRRSNETEEGQQGESMTADLIVEWGL